MLVVALTDTIIPWILGTLLLLMSLTCSMALKSWRDIKRSSYFFLRRRAEKRLQTYLSTSLCLMFVTVGVAAFTWQTPQDSTPRMAILTNEKPPDAETIALFEDSAQETTITLEETTPELSAEPPTPTLPEQFNQYEPQTELNPDTALGSLLFSTEINDDYEALEPQRIFPEGNFTLFATFSYEAMADGMAWAWVWRYDGEVVDGGNELWEYGDEGPGYIFFNPEEGFSRGEYSLEVWVNGQLLTQSAVVMNTAAVSAGN